MLDNDDDGLEPRPEPLTDPEAEANLLGGILLKPATYISTGIGRTLRAHDFFYKKHQVIFGAVTALSNEGIECHPFTVLDRLERDGQLAYAGGRQYILDLCNVTAPISALESYARIIKSMAQRRALRTAAEEIARSALAPRGKDPRTLLAHAQEALLDLQDARDGQVMPFNTALMGFIERLEHGDAGLLEKGLDTGFTELDTAIRGLRPGTLNVIAARPGMGKTAFAMNMVSFIAMAGQTDLPALVFSLEMTVDELVLRQLCGFARADAETVLEHKLSDGQLHTVFRKTGAMVTEKDGRQVNKLYIDDGENDVTSMRSKARALAASAGGISVIMVDYLQLMKEPGRFETRDKEISFISRSLKLLAKELDCPVVALSQLNREAEKRRDHRPINADLRDSGSIEQDADVVAFLHQDYYYTKLDEDIGKAVLILSKNRAGRTRDINLVFQGEYYTFYDDTGRGQDGQ